MFFFPPLETLAEDFVPKEKKMPSQKSKEPTYQLSPWLVLDDVLAQYLRANRQVVLGSLPAVSSASSRCFSEQPPI